MPATMRGVSKGSEPPEDEDEDEDEELRKESWRGRGIRYDSITRRHITIYYLLVLAWLAMLLHSAWRGESYTPMRGGGVMYTTGAGLWVQCLGPVLIMLALFFRLDQASLGVSNRRGWALACGVLGLMTYILAPNLFGQVSFLH